MTDEQTFRESINTLIFKSQLNDLFDCQGCTGIFKENEVSVVEAVVREVKDMFLLCAKCNRLHGVKKKYK